MTGPFPKLTIATVTARTTATTVVTVLRNERISCYGISAKVLTDNGPQLAFKVFKAI